MHPKSANFSEAAPVIASNSEHFSETPSELHSNSEHFLQTASVIAFNSDICRNESEVISKLIVSYLLPQLGYTTDTWHQEVKLNNKRLDFLTMIVPAVPFDPEKISPPSIVIEAKHPRENLSRHYRRLRQYMEELNAWYGILTNARELKIFGRDNDWEILPEPVFACYGGDIGSRISEIKSMLGREKLAEVIPHAKSVPKLPEKEINREDEVEESEGNILEKSKEKPNMNILAVYHNKGGVGKTTVSVNLAAALRLKGKRVLLIDMDAQANSTFATGLIKFQFEEDDDIIGKYVYHLLETGEFNPIPAVLRSSNGFNTPEIDVIPSHINLIEHQDRLNKIAASRSRLIVKLRNVREKYDYVIIDTPPSRDLYAEIPLIAADYLIIPSDLKPFANQGLNNVKAFVKEVNEFKETISLSPLKVLGVLPSKISTNNQFLKYTFPKQKSAVPEKHGFNLMNSIIFDRTPLSNCFNLTKKCGDAEIPDPKSIFEFCKIDSSPSSQQAAGDFEALAAEVISETEFKKVLT
ncbi:MAG: AAA family ATPase [Candidatus Riflebacteria bacterium]|nr:AAA family ATPase [Candidatus Riflebacteria bacterium]